MQNLNEIFDKARDLAEMLLETEEGKAMNDAKFVFDGDEEAQNMLNQYSIYRNSVQQRVQDGTITQEEFEKENEVMAEKIKELQANKVISDLFIAEQNFNHVINHVMNVFNATLAGEPEVGGCGGSCGGCSGCH